MMFWILHIFAVLFFIPALILTIPLHLINGSIRANNPDR